MKSWVLSASPQSGHRAESRIGGPPRLPAAEPAPHCGLCGALETCFFSVAFPSEHGWAGRSLTVFACTSCADENYFIPEMLNGPLAGAVIPAGFLASYQRNFRLFVFPTCEGTDRTDIEARIEPLELTFEEAGAGAELTGFGWVGGAPRWLLDDEAPASYEGVGEMLFLLQITPGLTFPRASGAPDQVTLGLDGKPRPSGTDSYQLFLGNAVYFFGTATGEPAVYALTQID
jgi:hypothetical protein